MSAEAWRRGWQQAEGLGMSNRSRGEVAGLLPVVSEGFTEPIQGNLSDRYSANTTGEVGGVRAVDQT